MYMYMYINSTVIKGCPCMYVYELYYRLGIVGV